MSTINLQEALSPVRLEQLQSENPFVHITDAVYEILEEAILSSRLDPGSKLRINTIADTLGVSGTPVREAMERLIARGLVAERVEPGRKYRSYTDFSALLQSVAEAAASLEPEIISVYYGEDVQEQDAQATGKALEKAFPDADVNVVSGGQPVYYYMISLE